MQYFKHVFSRILIAILMLTTGLSSQAAGSIIRHRSFFNPKRDFSYHLKIQAILAKESHYSKSLKEVFELKRSKV